MLLLPVRRSKIKTNINIIKVLTAISNKKEIASSPKNKLYQFIFYYPLSINPPFGCNVWPVRYEESSDAKNKKQGATSFG